MAMYASIVSDNSMEEIGKLIKQVVHLQPPTNRYIKHCRTIYKHFKSLKTLLVTIEKPLLGRLIPQPDAAYIKKYLHLCVTKRYHYLKNMTKSSLLTLISKPKSFFLIEKSFVILIYPVTPDFLMVAAANSNSSYNNRILSLHSDCPVHCMSSTKTRMSMCKTFVLQTVLQGFGLLIFRA